MGRHCQISEGAVSIPAPSSTTGEFQFLHILTHTTLSGCDFTILVVKMTFLKYISFDHFLTCRLKKFPQHYWGNFQTYRKAENIIQGAPIWDTIT